MSISTDVDIRLYNANGTRKHLPQQWIESAEFEIGERGGCLTGALRLAVEWQNLQLTGTEYCDIRMWGSGQVLYRGWLRQTQQELGNPETASPAMFGLMALLNGYQVRRDYTFAAASIDVVFLRVAQDIVTRSGRLTSVVLDTTGVAALGITVDVFSSNGKNFSDAMNALCDLAPGQLIWGCDVDGSGNNRLYLRPRATTPKYVFPVGGNVTAFTYPQDANQVVNRIVVTGGSIQPPNLPNLVNNPSFEEVTQPGETTSNLLQNPSFETANGASPTHPALWQVINDPTLASGNGRTGSNALDMDNNPAANETVYQDVLLVGAQTVYQSCWFQLGTSTASTLQLELQAYDASSTLLGTNTQNFSLSTASIPQLVWQHLQTSWTTPANTVRVRVSYTLTATTGNNNLDDCSFWTLQPNAQGWTLGTPVDAYVNTITWDYGTEDVPNSPTPLEPGVVMVKVQPVITASDGYVELTTTVDARTNISAYSTYAVAFRVAGSTLNPGAMTAYCGVRVWGGDTLQTSVPGPQAPGISAPAITAVPVSIPNTATWTLVTFQFTVTATSTAVDLFLRLTASGIAYVDGAQIIKGLIGGPYGQTLFTLDGTYRAMRDVTSSDVAPGLTTAAAASITTWGERESEVTNDSVIDDTTMAAYAISYFLAHATPAIQARLTVEGAVAPLPLDGLVRLVNLPNGTEPPPLPAAKVRYSIGNTIRLDADLNNERPDQALLLRRIQGSGLGGVPWP